MKLFISALFLLSSVTALSDSHMSGYAFEYFHGKGHYEAPNGKHKGKFLVSLMIRKHESGEYSLRYSLHSKHHDMKYRLVLGKPAASGIFSVSHRGEDVGYGYCVGKGVCHLNYSVDGIDVEDTFSLNKHHGRGYKHDRKHPVDADAEADEPQAHSGKKKGKRMFFSMGSKSRDGAPLKSWVMHLHKVY